MIFEIAVLQCSYPQHILFIRLIIHTSEHTDMTTCQWYGLNVAGVVLGSLADVHLISPYGPNSLSSTLKAPRSPTQKRTSVLTSRASLE